MKQRSVAFILVFVLLAGISGGCRSTESDEAGGETEIVIVERGSLVTSVTATGTVLPAAEVVLSFEVGGRVAQVLVTAGQRVQRGEALARLDTTDLMLQVRGAEAALAAAQARLDQLTGGAREEEITIAQAQLEAAEAALAQAIAQREQAEAGATDAEIAAAEAQVASAMAQQKIAQDTYDQMMRCRTVRLPTGEEEEICPTLGTLEEQARYNLNAANEALAAAQAQLAALTAGKEERLRAAEAAVQAAAAQRDVAKAQLDLLLAGPTTADIVVARASVDQAEVALETARLALERATLRAPFDGIVARVDVEPGELVVPQMPAITLIDDSRFRIETDVDEADIGWVEVGQDAQITLDAFPGHGLTGEVTAIAPSATLNLGVVSYRVTVEINPTVLALRGGMTANVEIIRDRRENVLLVPNRAIWIDTDTGQPFVEKIVDGEIVVVPIEQGSANEQFSEVLSGLSEGDQLVIRSTSLRERFRRVVTMPMTGQ